MVEMITYQLNCYHEYGSFREFLSRALFDKFSKVGTKCLHQNLSFLVILQFWNNLRESSWLDINRAFAIFFEMEVFKIIKDCFLFEIAFQVLLLVNFQN